MSTALKLKPKCWSLLFVVNQQFKLWFDRKHGPLGRLYSVSLGFRLFTNLSFLFERWPGRITITPFAWDGVECGCCVTTWNLSSSGNITIWVLPSSGNLTPDLRHVWSFPFDIYFELCQQAGGYVMSRWLLIHFAASKNREYLGLIKLTAMCRA